MISYEEHARFSSHCIHISYYMDLSLGFTTIIINQSINTQQDEESAAHQSLGMHSSLLI